VMTGKVTTNDSGRLVDALCADSGAKVTINGDVEGTSDWCVGVEAIGRGTEVTVNGNVSGSIGVKATYGAKVTINGNAFVNAAGSGSGVVSGSETTTGRDDSVVIVNGNVTGHVAGLSVFNGAKAFVTGNVVGFQTGVNVKGGGEAAVDGTVTAATSHYVTLHTLAYSGKNYKEPTTREGYRTYADNRGNVVWVKGPLPPDPKPKTVFSTRYESIPWNWIRFFLLFGWIWMWF